MPLALGNIRVIGTSAMRLHLLTLKQQIAPSIKYNILFSPYVFISQVDYLSIKGWGASGWGGLSSQVNKGHRGCYFVIYIPL